jgi:hypothetical protein
MGFPLNNVFVAANKPNIVLFCTLPIPLPETIALFYMLVFIASIKNIGQNRRENIVVLVLQSQH